MEKIDKENKMLALIPATFSDKTLVYEESTPILDQISQTQNTRKTEEQEMSMLPDFLHIVTCYLTIIKRDHINMFIDYVKDKCNHMNSMDLDTSCILRNIKRKMQIFLEFTKQHNDFVHQNMNWFQQRLFDIYVTCNPNSYKTFGAPKITTKFRPIWPVVTREVSINESGEEFDSNTISNIVVLQAGIITYSRHYMTICCMTRNGDRNSIPCPSSVTDFTRISQDAVLATLPFRQMILVINSSSFKIQKLSLGFYKVSYLELSSFVGVEMFCKSIYLVDWVDKRITKQFVAKEIPTDISVGPQSNLLISFSNINRVTCYNLDGQQLFEVETHSLDQAINITIYKNYFYVLQGHIIYKISATGSMTMREIGMKCQHISVGTDIILVTDYVGILHVIKTNKDFWPRLSHNYQLCTPKLKNPICIEDCYKITNILPMSTSSTLIIYKNKKAILLTDTGAIISQNDLNFLEIPSIVCRMNSNRFLVFYHKIKGLQYITYPELAKGPLIMVDTDYIKICHITSNKFLALTTNDNRDEVHILLIKEDKVYIIERISLEHENVTIAATPVNFVVVDGRKNKLVFYSISGEELFEKYLPFYCYSNHIYSDNVYFHVLFKRQSIVICYNIYGEIKWQWKVPFSVHPHIAVFQGTVYVPDIEHNRVLLYTYHHWSSCCLHTKNPYIRNLNIQLKGKDNDKILIAKMCHLANGQLVVCNIDNDCLLYISNEGNVVFRLPLPSTVTHICRWDCNQIGVTLPLEKQLRVIGNLSKTVRTISLSHPYVQVCQLGEDQIVSYCDKPSHLDILAIKKYNQVEIIHRINIPFAVKSLAIENETLNLLIITRGKAFRYNTNFGHGSSSSSSSSRSLSRSVTPFNISPSDSQPNIRVTPMGLLDRGHVRSGRSCDGSSHNIKMVPKVLLSESLSSLYGGSIDKMSVYLIDNSRLFAINDHDVVVSDLITNNQLDIFIDLVDIFSRNICVSEMLSSTLYLQDLTVSDKARDIDFYDIFHYLVITENNLIAGFDTRFNIVKIFTFDGQFLDSIKLNGHHNISMHRGQSNTLVFSCGELRKQCQLLILKVEFPLSFVTCWAVSIYDSITPLSNNHLVCKMFTNVFILHIIDIDEIDLTANIINIIEIPETILTIDKDDYSTKIYGIAVTADDVIIVNCSKFIIFLNSDGQYMYSVRHYLQFSKMYETITTADNYLYIYGQWDKYYALFGVQCMVCLTQTGEYIRKFLNNRIYKDDIHFPNIDCKGPRFVANDSNRLKLYSEGLFMVNRESFPISHLQTDKCPVQVKDLDISDEGKTVVCEKSNNGNIKIFDEAGELLCYRNVGSLVGGVCFTEERDIMATVPKRQEIFQLKQQNLEKINVWQIQIPYGVIWTKAGNIYWCVHINMTECDTIKIDGDQLNIMESISLLKLDSGLHFPSIASQRNNEEIFSNELINKLENSGKDGERCKSGEIVGKGRLKVRCGNYIVESMSGIDKILVRRLPHRTAMVPLSILTYNEPVNYNHIDIKDRSSKLIKLDDNVSVLMFRDTVTLISTTTGDILQNKQLPKQPVGICRWTDECFIIVFGKEMMIFNRRLCHLKTINTEKYYNTIYKYNDNQLVCGGHYIRDITQDEKDKHYKEEWYNKFYYFCVDVHGYESYYVDIVDIKDGECKHEVCHGETGVLLKLEGDVVVFDVAVTYFGDVIVARWEKKEEKEKCWFNTFFVEWYREDSLIRRITLEKLNILIKYDIYRPFLTVIGEYVYITDSKNNIYQIPEHIEYQTSENIKKYLLLRHDENEVYQVLGFDISDNSFMVFGIIPGRQSFAFFHYDK